MTRNRRAFTIIELLVTVLIISILAGLLFSALRKIRVMSKRMTCMNNLRQAGLGLLLYRNDYEGRLPMVTGAAGAFTEWAELLVPIVSSNVLYGRKACPEMYFPNSPGITNEVIMGNIQLMGGDPQYVHSMDDVRNRSETFLLSCGFVGAAWSPTHFEQLVTGTNSWNRVWDGAGLNVHFVDGHTEFVRYGGPSFGTNAPTKWWVQAPYDSNWPYSGWQIFGP